MRAAWYERTGLAAEVLQVGEMPKPEPGPGDVLVRVKASGINPADVKRRAGWGGMAIDHQRVIPHCDGAGAIEAVGKGVPPERIGSRVWLWNAQGGYGAVGRADGTAAEWIALPAEQAVPLPAALSFDAGACLGVPAITAHRTVFADGPVTGQTILVQGGAGAVGHFAVQMARLGGARVLATVGSAEGATHAEAAGAEPILRRQTDVAAAVMAATGGCGVDRIVEVDFAANAAVDAPVLVPNGTIASFSSTSNPAPVLPYYSFAAKGLNLRFIQGFALPPAARGAAHAFIATHATALNVAIRGLHDLFDIAKAHESVEKGGIGNVVLRL